MLPTLALVGRPNVGKSTLFNRLTRSRDALVHDLPGLTRDRNVGRARFGDREFFVVDTPLEHVPVREAVPEPPESERRVRVAIVGRPNVGKSTLVNALLGEERVIAFDQPGTTRDSIALDFERDGKRYTIVDTAGVRRQGKVIETAEKFSVIKTMQAIDDANVVVLMLDAEDGVTEQDAHLAGHVLEAGRALVLAI